ncbi:NAD(P)/FAD-dependent oxidoreductase [Candidatus Neomarinimicrobiota bacterium]
MPDTESIYDLIIVGGGPAGATAALYAERAGLRTLLVDKATFPRDKICGDGLSGKSVTILQDLNLLEQVRQLPGALVHRVVFISPAHDELVIDLRESNLSQIFFGFVIRRHILDQFMLEQAKRVLDTCIEGFQVKDLIWQDGYVKGVRGAKEGEEDTEYYGRIILGADGYNSIVARKSGLYHHDPKHWVVALRQYYRNVDCHSDQIELHFTDEVTPGYFWIFPLEDGRANVGIGMLHASVKRRDVDLREALRTAIESPTFRNRFSHAEPLEEPVGWNLPVGSKHRRMTGNGFMLVGDAAGLIDPFTGEGIGNALYSAKFAVQAARRAIDENDVSGKFFRDNYDLQLWKEIGGELRLSTQLQKIGGYRTLLNFVIRKAARNKEIANLIGGMLVNEFPRKKLVNPLFYLKLIFS